MNSPLSLDQLSTTTANTDLFHTSVPSTPSTPALYPALLPHQLQALSFLRLVQDNTAHSPEKWISFLNLIKDVQEKKDLEYQDICREVIKCLGEWPLLVKEFNQFLPKDISIVEQQTGGYVIQVQEPIVDDKPTLDEAKQFLKWLKKRLQKQKRIQDYHSFKNLILQHKQQKLNSNELAQRVFELLGTLYILMLAAYPDVLLRFNRFLPECFRVPTEWYQPTLYSFPPIAIEVEPHQPQQVQEGH